MAPYHHSLETCYTCTVAQHIFSAYTITKYIDKKTQTDRREAPSVVGKESF